MDGHSTGSEIQFMTIEGVNILNTVEKVSTSDMLIGIVDILLGILLIGIAIWVIVQMFTTDPPAFIILWMIIISIFDLFIGTLDIYFGIKHVTNQQTFIQATVDEHTSWKQINEQYDLVSKDGQIYTFTLKESE